jgi:hypothetical protein
MVTIGFFNLVACNSDDAVVVVSNPQMVCL